MRMERVAFTKFALSDGGRYALKTVDDDALTATSNQNCRCVDGKLFLGLGVKSLKDASGKEMTTGQTVRAVIPASYWQNNTEHQCPVIVTAQGKLYQYNESTGAWTEIPATVAGNVGVCAGYDRLSGGIDPSDLYRSRCGDRHRSALHTKRQRDLFLFILLSWKPSLRRCFQSAGLSSALAISVALAAGSCLFRRSGRNDGTFGLWSAEESRRTVREG